MKRQSLALLSIVSVSLIIIFSSCKKINEPTELGSDLIPGVDNVHTFELSLNTVTDNVRFDDSTKLNYADQVAIGDINDPEFGQTHGDAYFNISPSSFGTYPFINKDSVIMDSVVLSLAYTEGYGDTLNGSQTFRVYEISQSATINDTTLYKFSDPASAFATTGSQLGSATFNVRNLKDSITLIRARDTSKVANVVRIKLDPSLAQRFAQYDTTSSPNGGYHSDSLFRTLFKGLAIKADAGGNVLTYFSLSNTANTKLTVYFRATKGGVIDTTSFDYFHTINGQSNYIQRTPGGGWANYLTNGSTNDDKLYIQSAPFGSYGTVVIPDLSTLSNKVIHRAELIVTRIPSASDNIFSPPSRLLLDRTKTNVNDSAFMLQNDLIADATGTINYAPFGGTLNSDNTYRFNISRYVQGVITKHASNDTLRIYAPLRTILYNSNLGLKISVPGISQIANGRVVLAGGNYTDPNARLRLRIIYSEL